MSRHRERDRTPPENSYEVGYGKPPKHSQWQKGQSGNSKGRRPRSKNTNTLVQELLDQTIVVRLDGKRKRVSAREAVIRRILEKALNGDLKALQFLLEHDQKGLAEARAAAQALHSAAEEMALDAAILQEVLDMLPGDPTAPNPSSGADEEDHLPSADDGGQGA